MTAEQSDRAVGLGQGLESRRRQLAESVAPLAETPLRVGVALTVVAAPW
ncbi:hypothetical protein [Haloterrigena salina]|nr:hypothetical protein [Haloterrigena salina]